MISLWLLNILLMSYLCLLRMFLTIVFSTFKNIVKIFCGCLQTLENMYWRTVSWFLILSFIQIFTIEENIVKMVWLLKTKSGNTRRIC